MRFKPVAQNPLEWFALQAGLVPIPLAYSHFGFVMSKAILEATDKGIFEAIGHQKISPKQIAKHCKLNERAVTSLLGVLASMGLLKNHHELFSLTRQAKKWLLKGSPQSAYWLMLFDNRVCFKWMDYVGEFLETGKGLQYHDSFTEEEWFYYQKAMEASARATSKEVVKKIPVPAQATKMMDIGGSHGLYSLELCKKYPSLSSVIVDLPNAVSWVKADHESPQINNDIQYVAADILQYDAGENEYDLIIMANLAHHFTNEQNILVAQKAFRALKLGGYFVILEVLRPVQIKLNNDMLSSIGDFFFSLSSTSGTWSLEQIKGWQQKAGLQYIRKITFLSIPGYAAVISQKK